MEHQKLPGIDRLPIDFFKQFLKQMKHLQETYNSALIDIKTSPKT